MQGQERGQAPAEGLAQRAGHLFGEAAFQQDIRQGEAFLGEGQPLAGALAAGFQEGRVAHRRGGQADGVVSNFLRGWCGGQGGDKG